MAILPYKLLGLAVLQEFLQVPCSWLPDYRSVCGCWLLTAPVELGVSCWREHFFSGILAHLHYRNYVIWENDSFRVVDDNRCVHHLSRSFPFAYFTLVSLSSALLNLSLGIVLKVDCKQLRGIFEGWFPKLKYSLVRGKDALYGSMGKEGMCLGTKT